MTILAITNQRCEQCEGRGWKWRGPLNEASQIMCTTCLGMGSKLEGVDLASTISQLIKDNRIPEINV